MGGARDAGGRVTGEFMIDTFSGQRLDLDDPRPEQIDIEDIASALSKVCRFGAQATTFYSVAQHAVLVQRLVIDAGHTDLALAALHHDSHEAFTEDIPSPLKRKMKDGGNAVYTEVCDALDRMIAVRFGFSFPEPASEAEAAIKRADEKARVMEARGVFRAAATSIEAAVSLSTADLQSLDEHDAALLPDAARNLFVDAHHAAVARASE